MKKLLIVLSGVVAIVCFWRLKANQPPNVVGSHIPLTKERLQMLVTASANQDYDLGRD